MKDAKERTPVVQEEAKSGPRDAGGRATRVLGPVGIQAGEEWTVDECARVWHWSTQEAVP